MSTRNRASGAAHLLSVVAAAGFMGLSGWASPAGILGGDDDKPLVPGLDDGTKPCTITSSDPRHHNACNTYGHDGSVGEAGSVHGHPDDWAYHESVNDRIHEEEAKDGRSY